MQPKVKWWRKDKLIESSQRIKKPIKKKAFRARAKGKKSKDENKINNQGLSIAMTRDDTPMLQQKLTKKTIESVSLIQED